MADPIKADFSFPASPGDGWPAVIGSVAEETGPLTPSSLAPDSSAVSVDEEGGFLALLMWGASS